MINKVHAIVHVDSRGRNEGVSASTSDFLFQLTQPINFHKRSETKQYFIRCENIKLPVSFYNINSNYNTLNYTTSVDGAQSATLTPGNYTIDELITELETQMNADLTPTVTITYNEFTQKVSINVVGTPTTDDITSLSGSLLDIIGFTGITTLPASTVSGTTTTGTYVAYTNTASCLKLILSNLVSNNVYSNTITSGHKQTNLQNVSVTIPIKEIRNEFVFFNNHMGPMIKLPNLSSIKNLNIKLVDMFNNVVDLNGLWISFDIVIYEYNKSPLFTNL